GELLEYDAPELAARVREMIGHIGDGNPEPLGELRIGDASLVLPAAHVIQLEDAEVGPLPRLLALGAELRDGQSEQGPGELVLNEVVQPVGGGRLDSRELPLGELEIERKELDLPSALDPPRGLLQVRHHSVDADAQERAQAHARGIVTVEKGLFR